VPSFTVRKTALPFECGDVSGSTVSNKGPKTVYYRDELPVSASSNDGSISSGSSATLYGTQYFIVDQGAAADVTDSASLIVAYLASAPGSTTPAVPDILGRHDLLNGSPIVIGQEIYVEGGPYIRKTSNGTIDTTTFANTRYTKMGWPHMPRNHPANVYGSRGTGGSGSSRKLRFQRPTPTGERAVTLVIDVADVATTKDFRFDWDTDVIVQLPTTAWPNDLHVFDARSVTIIGGKLTATGARASAGGHIECRGIRDFIWLEGVHLDMVGRVDSLGAPDQQDGLNLCGKSRQGSDSGHRVGDATATYKTGGVDILDYTGTSIRSKYGGFPASMDWTRYSFPDIYLQNVRVDGVLGQNTGGTHGDILQYQGPVGGVYIHNFTGTTQYQGFQQQPAQGVLGPYVISRCNLKGYDPVTDSTGDSVFLYWFPPGTAGNELPQVYLDEVFAGPALNASGTGYKTLDQLVMPNPQFYSTGADREALDVGYVDQGYTTLPRGTLRIQGDAATDTVTTYRFNADGQTITATAHGYSNGDRVVFSSIGNTVAGTARAGITTETVAYYVVNKTATTFQPSLTLGGAPIDITSNFAVSDPTGGFFFVNRMRMYIAPQPPLPYFGVIFEGLPSDTDFCTSSDCGIAYVPPGSQEPGKGAPVAVNTVAASGATYTVPDPVFYESHDITLSANCTFTFPTPVTGKKFMLQLRQDGTGTRLATWPASVSWSGGTAPTLTVTASKKDVFRFEAFDGTKWIGSTVGLNFT
jgi:hypothetical protein